METIAEDGGSRGGKAARSQRENEAEGVKDKTTAQRRYRHGGKGGTKSALVKIQGRRWREAIITIHQDNK